MRTYFGLIANRHVKVITVRSDKFPARKNLMFLLLGAYVVSTYIAKKSGNRLSIYNIDNLNRQSSSKNTGDIFKLSELHKWSKARYFRISILNASVLTCAFTTIK